MQELTLEEVVATTRASRRNVKYWTALYDLPFRRDGRRNLYPPVTVTLLGAIVLLSEHALFTTTYIRWLVDRVLERSPADPRRAARIARNWDSITEAFGETGLLPPELVSFLATAEPPPLEVPRGFQATPTQPPIPGIGSASSYRRTRDDDALL